MFYFLSLFSSLEKKDFFVVVVVAFRKKMFSLPQNQKHFLLKIYLLVVFLTVYVVYSDPSACEKKILKDYPTAECSLEKDKDTCRLFITGQGDS
jgi:hypothetical protein